MTEHTIKRESLGSLTKIGQGGQGVVYRAPGFKTKFTNSMVFKEYKADALLDIDFDALSAMPVLVEELMSYNDAERLIAIAAWPCAIVEQNGQPVGQVMPAIPDRFTMPLKTARGTSQVNAEIQHLLNHPSILAAREIAIDDVQRYSLLLEIASELEFLHRNNICVGDISPKNLLFSLWPAEAAYFIDCDTMAANGVSALPQVETPGWEVPDGESPATIYSDSYKFGLLALRLLAGDQDVRDPKRAPSKTPAMLRKVITDALTNEPMKRPLPTAWTYILGHALEEAQQRQLDSPTEDQPVDDPAPPIPVVRTRPKPSAHPKPTPPQSISAPSTSIPSASPIPAAQSSTALSMNTQRRNVLIGAGIAAAAVIALFIVIIAVSTSSGGSSYTPNRTSTPGAFGGSEIEPTSQATKTTTITRSSVNTATPTTNGRNVITLTPPPPGYLVADQDANNETCPSGISLAAPGNHYAARGTTGTTCLFAKNVGAAYVNSDPDPTTIKEIVAQGSRDCSGVEGNPRCANGGRDYIMTCYMRGGEGWVTCMGGNKAVVYIY